MEERRRILLLGGTGTIGEGLKPELLRRGYQVFVTSRSPHRSNEQDVIYLQGNAKDEAFLDDLLSEQFDAIVDFMIYTTDSFRERAEKLLNEGKIALSLAGHIHIPFQKLDVRGRGEIVAGSLTKMDILREITFADGVFSVRDLASDGRPRSRA